MTANLFEGPSVAVRRALLSVSDKTGLLEFAKALAAHGVELLSTGGTAKALREAGLAVKDVSDHTGFPEMMDGRVKTLHPKVHGGLLGRAGIDDAVMAEHGIEAIDLLVLNLYPFAKVSMDPSSTFEDVIENIDIGGPASTPASSMSLKRTAARCRRRRASGSPWPRSTTSPSTTPASATSCPRSRTTAAMRSSPRRPTAIS